MHILICRAEPALGQVELLRRQKSRGTGAHRRCLRSLAPCISRRPY